MTPKAVDDFDPGNSQTWDEKQLAVYDTGHREGESCERATWMMALYEQFDIDADTPHEAIQALNAYYLALFEEIIDQTHDIWITKEMAAKGDIGDDIAKHWDTLRAKLRQAAREKLS